MLRCSLEEIFCILMILYYYLLIVANSMIGNSSPSKYGKVFINNYWRSRLLILWLIDKVVFAWHKTWSRRVLLTSLSAQLVSFGREVTSDVLRSLLDINFICQSMLFKSCCWGVVFHRLEEISALAVVAGRFSNIFFLLFTKHAHTQWKHHACTTIKQRLILVAITINKYDKPCSV